MAGWPTFLRLALFGQPKLLSLPAKTSKGDPFTRYITLDRDFVSLANLQGIIGDPHFVTRDRMGRDLAFMCRIYLNGWSCTPRDIAIDEKTALLIDLT